MSWGRRDGKQFSQPLIKVINMNIQFSRILKKIQLLTKIIWPESWTSIRRLFFSRHHNNWIVWIKCPYSSVGINVKYWCRNACLILFFALHNWMFAGIDQTALTEKKFHQPPQRFIHWVSPPRGVQGVIEDGSLMLGDCNTNTYNQSCFLCETCMRNTHTHTHSHSHTHTHTHTHTPLFNTLWISKITLNLIQEKFLNSANDFNGK